MIRVRKHKTVEAAISIELWEAQNVSKNGLLRQTPINEKLIRPFSRRITGGEKGNNLIKKVDFD